MTDTDVVKAKVAKNILRLLNHTQFCRGNRFTVRHSRAQASHLRLIGGGKTELGGKLPDFRFGQTHLLERSADLKLGSRLSARPIIANVARVFPIGDNSDTIRLGNRDKFGKQLVFTKVTAVVWIRDVTWVLEFLRSNDPHRKGELPPKSQ